MMLQIFADGGLRGGQVIDGCQAGFGTGLFRLFLGNGQEFTWPVQNSHAVYKAADIEPFLVPAGAGEPG